MNDGRSGDNGDRAPDHPEGPSGAETGSPGGITNLNDVLDSLTSARRRRILYYMHTNTVAELDEVATYVAATEAKVSPDEVTDEQRKQIEVQLVHSDLPRLAEAHFIEYDRRSNTIRYANPPRLLHRVLKLLAKLEDRTLS